MRPAAIIGAKGKFKNIQLTFLASKTLPSEVIYAQTVVWTINGPIESIRNCVDYSRANKIEKLYVKIDGAKWFLFIVGILECVVVFRSTQSGDFLFFIVEHHTQICQREKRSLQENYRLCSHQVRKTNSEWLTIQSEDNLTMSELTCIDMINGILKEMVFSPLWIFYSIGWIWRSTNNNKIISALSAGHYIS